MQWLCRSHFVAMVFSPPVNLCLQSHHFPWWRVILETIDPSQRTSKPMKLQQVRAGDQKWEIIEIAVGIIFFVWSLYSLLFLQGVFKSHLKKSPHLKCQFPPKIPIWSKSLLHKPFEKWLNPPTPHYPGECVNYANCRNLSIWLQDNKKLYTISINF